MAPAELIRALGIPTPKALLLILGGADEMDPSIAARLQQLFSQGLAPAVAESEAVILDGGTQTGIMALTGQSLAGRRERSTLIGVAPAGRVSLPGGADEAGARARSPLEPNHSHFVLVEGDTWGGETRVLFRLASAFAREAPVLVLLVNGGDIAREEVLQAVRQRWPIVLLRGSGRLADELAAAFQAGQAPPTEPVTAEILADGKLCLFPIDGAPEAFGRLILHHVGMETTLKLAWQRFATYDTNAAREQTLFRRLRLWILLLGVTSTALAVLHQEHLAPLLADLLHVLIVISAAGVTALVAASSRFKAGNKWILLRANAEAIKQEIYRYRCRVSPLFQRPRGSCEQDLVEHMKTLSQKMMQDEPSMAALRFYKGPLPPPGSAAPGDDGLTLLTPERYIRWRLDDQLGFYRGKVDQLDKQVVTLQWILIAFGALGTVLAAVRLDPWVPLTSAVVMALTAHLGYQQSESRIMKYQQAAIELENLKAWWGALSLEEQEEPRHFEALVEGTEAILRREVAGWAKELKEVFFRMDAQTRELVAKMMVPADGARGPELEGEGGARPRPQKRKPDGAAP
jgi:hypothetical protein